MKYYLRYCFNKFEHSICYNMPVKIGMRVKKDSSFLIPKVPKESGNTKESHPIELPAP